MNQATSEDRIACALDRIGDILEDHTAEMAERGRIHADINRKLDMLIGEVRTALKRLTAAEGRVAGLEMARDSDELGGNGNGHA